MALSVARFQQILSSLPADAETANVNIYFLEPDGTVRDVNSINIEFLSEDGAADVCVNVTLEEL